MILFPSLGLFMLAALVLLVVPGPAVLYIVTRSVSQGRRAGLASVLGIEAGSLVHSMAAAVGLSAILLASATAFTVVKYLGAAYLVYLGIRAFLTPDAAGSSENAVVLSARQLFLKGFVVQILNPKTALFFYAFLPQFVDPSRGALMAQTLMLGGIFVLMATCTDGLYALLGSGVGRLILQRPAFQRARRYVSGAIYVALGIAAAVTGEGRK
jgi:threonine/homoserine/homoserine lactone efflux protein